MRFQTFTALVVLAIVSTSSLVAAQIPQIPQIPDLSNVPNPACYACIAKNMLGLASCAGVVLSGVPDFTTLTPTQKKCYCAMAGNQSWATSCQGPLTCTEETVKSLTGSYDANKGAVCAAALGTDGSPPGSAASCNKANMAGAAMMVVAAAAAQLL